MDDLQPTSELEILKQQGLSATPEHRSPSPPEAKAAGRRYIAALQEFDRLLDQIRSYEGQPLEAAAALAVQHLIDGAMLTAADVRVAANGLGLFPKTFIPLASGVAYFGEIANNSDQAYRKRISKLKKLRLRYHRLSLGGRADPIVPLSAHENVLRGWHLLERHVDISEADLLKRLSNYDRVSAFFDRRIAERAVVQLLEYHFDDINDWLDSTREPTKEFTFTYSENVGRVLTRSDHQPQLTKHLILVVIRDSVVASLRFPDGFRIKTGYPILDDDLR